MHFMKNLLFALPLLCLTACGPTLVMDRAPDGTPILIRSAQPSASDLAEIQSQYGLQTILNLRGADVMEDPEVTWHVVERAYAVGNDIGYFVLDFNDGTEIPSETDLELFDFVVCNRQFWPILIHCQAGIHRTGFLAAYYRIKHQGWDPERAIEEMESHWFDWSAADRSRIKRYLRKLKCCD